MKEYMKIRIEDAEVNFRKCLQRVPFLEIESFENEPLFDNFRADLFVTVRIEEKRYRLLIEAKNNGQPRFARTAAYELARVLKGKSDVYGVFMAPYISPQVADICLKENIGYMDLAGNYRLTFGQVYLEHQGVPNPAEKRDLRSLYFPKASRILRVLLADPKKSWRIQALAETAKVSLGQIFNVKKLLEDREWINNSDNGFLLKDPEKLLAEWAQYFNPRKSKSVNFYTLKSIAGLEEDLARNCEKEGIPYALTGFSGAARYSASVRYQRVMAYVLNDPEKIANILSLKDVSSGANVTLLSPIDEGVLFGARQINGIWIASPVQVYLDLLGSGGRGEEAAEAILNEVIKRLW